MRTKTVTRRRERDEGARPARVLIVNLSALRRRIAPKRPGRCGTVLGVLAVRVEYRPPSTPPLRPSLEAEYARRGAEERGSASGPGRDYPGAERSRSGRSAPYCNLRRCAAGASARFRLRSLDFLSRNLPPTGFTNYSSLFQRSLFFKPVIACTYVPDRSPITVRGSLDSSGTRHESFCFLRSDRFAKPLC